MLCLSYYCLFLLFNGTEKSAEQVLPRREEGEGKRVGVGAGERKTQTMYAHMNK
jgi:hypothetical protein